jgi:hypothetical protein
MEGAEDVEAARQGSDELAILRRHRFSKAVFNGTLQSGSSRDEMADIPHGVSLQ